VQRRNCGAGYPARGPAFLRVQPPGKAAAGTIACPTKQHSRNQAQAKAGDDWRNRLSHQEIVATREEIKIV